MSIFFSFLNHDKYHMALCTSKYVCVICISTVIFLNDNSEIFLNVYFQLVIFLNVYFQLVTSSEETGEIKSLVYYNLLGRHNIQIF